MATISELTNTIDSLRAELRVVAEEFFRLVDQANALERAGDRGPEFQRLSARISELREQRVRINNEISALTQQVQQLATVNSPTPEPPPAQSASQQVATQTNQAPQPLPSANQPVVATDTGTNPPVKPVEETQAITTASNNGRAPRPPASGASAEGTAGEAAAAAAVLQSGQGAKDDARNTAPPTAAVNATETVEPNIRPRPNILDEFASYTYSASVYMLAPGQYTQLLTSNNKRVNGYNLLFQSAGAANNRSGPQNADPGAIAQTDTADAGRNPFFDNDFYIDSITFETLPMGKGTNAAHNASVLKFTVVEPNGITLLDRLYDAVSNLSTCERFNYTAVEYLMVIRFYGYDAQGRPVQVRERSYDVEGTSDPQAVVEKFIPFRINNINWGVSSKMVTYEWDCTPIGQQIAGFTNRGTIPYDIQLTETTVGKLLTGSTTFSSQTAPAANPGASTTATSSDPRQRRSQVRLAASQASAESPPKASAAPSDKKVLTRGLVDALNQYQQDLVKRGIFTIADVYEIEFVGPGSEKIRDAVLASAGQNPIAQTASGRAATQDPSGLRPATNSVDKTTKNFSVTAGQQILQVIDLLIRNSSYIYDQALVIIDQDGTIKPNPNSRNQPIKWYNISMQAEQIGQCVDPGRNDYAYRIKYVISPFVVKNINSIYFPIPKFSGVHKSYPYWFTGQNTAVLDYNESLNALYHLTVSGEVPGDSLAKRNRDLYTSSLADIIKYNAAPRSSESSSGAQGKTNELAANAAESLYSPSDLAEATIKIVGDPAWIQQGTILRAANETVINAEAYNTGFLPDGSISFDSQDILFEIVWKRPNDYDIRTGKADPYARSASKYNNYSAEQSRVYYCTKVVSEFRQGRFEQTLHGALYQFPKPDQTNTANPAAAATATANQGTEGRVPVTNLTAPIPTRAAASELVAQQSRADFARVDPRRLDIGDGGVAAIEGARSSAALIKPNPPPVIINGRSTGDSIPRAVIEATVPQTTLFSQPQPPTSGPGTPVPSVVFRTPNRLPAADPRVGRLTNTQVQDLVNQQSSSVNTNPTSANNPANQRGVRDA